MTKMTKLLTSALRLKRSTGIGSTPLARRNLFSAPLAAGLCSVLAGCSAMTSIPPTTEVQGLQGRVHGGQQAVVGATIQLIAPGTTGYGSAGTVIVSATTDGNGYFTLPRPYTCPTNSGLVYLLATGGNAGAGTNSSLAEAAIVGPCSGLSASTFVYISEVTTVAAAYTLAPFASLSPGTTNIGTNSTNLTGLYNAAAAAGNLASTSSGQANLANSISGVTLPTAEMNTLADILASCVNSGTAGVGSTTCSTLFSAATPPGGTAPTDTFQAAIDIALNPGNNESQLYGLATPSAPYLPTLPSDPGDFALGIVYSGGDLGKAQPQGLDIDAQGNAWVSLYVVGRSPGAVNGLMEISPSGVISPSSGAYLSAMVDPGAVAITSGGVVVVPDYANTIYEYSPPGATGAGFSSGSASPTGLSGPTGIAINNQDGSMWITNNGTGTVSHISQSGASMAGSPFPAGTYASDIALGATGDVITANSYTLASEDLSSWTEYTPAGSGTYTANTASTVPGYYPSGAAIDSAGNFWLTVNSGVLVFSSSRSLLTPTLAGNASNSNSFADSIEIDGLGRAFVSNNNANQYSPGSLTVWTNNGTLISTANSNYGYFANNTIMADPFIPHGLALDASGNCWIAGNSPNQVTELIGIAAPVATPISVQVSTNQLGVRP